MYDYGTMARAKVAHVYRLEQLLIEARDVWLPLLWDEDGYQPEDDSSVASFKRRIDDALVGCK